MIGRGAVLLLALLVLADARKRIDPVAFQKSTPAGNWKLGDYKWSTFFYDGMPVDHFAAADDRYFALKYLMNNDYYKPGGPIFFYTGNEGTIEGFASNTGIMWDLAPLFNASLVFAEHRYYGNQSSIPFNIHNVQGLSVAQLSYLTSEQALADYATLIPYLKKNVLNCADDTPVIAFGGSYGGMLAAWFRMKYPHVVDGAWASSAPLLYFHNGGVAAGAFEHIIQETFTKSGCDVSAFSQAWKVIKAKANTTAGRDDLNRIFHVDKQTPVDSAGRADELINVIREGLEYMAMTDYPYPTSFLEQMPGWPVEAACKGLGTVPINDNKLLANVFESAMIYYNTSGKFKTMCLGCGDAATSGLGSFDGWDWQECTEILIEMCALGPPNDFFWNECSSADHTSQNFSVPDFQSGCQQSFGNDFKPDYVKPDKVARLYGLNMRGHSRIIFTGGLYDPWNSGSVTLKTPGMNNAAAREMYVFQIDGSAHHLDLRQPNSCDPPTVVNARYQIVNILQCWAFPDKPECKFPFEQQPLPAFQKADVLPDKCASEVNQFPWNQKTVVRPTPPFKHTTPSPCTTIAPPTTTTTSRVKNSPVTTTVIPTSRPKSVAGFFYSPFLVAVSMILAVRVFA